MQKQGAELRLTVGAARAQETIEYATEELCKYLTMMAHSGERVVRLQGSGGGAPDIRIGLFADFGVPLDGLRDPHKDDAVHVEVKESRGIIAGSNPRSALFAVYRFLEANGCRWLRPGRDGEGVPACGLRDLGAEVRDRAVSRFRGNHNGSASLCLEHVLDKIEWAPKVGLNTLFRELYTTKRGYHSLREPRRLSDAEVVAVNDQILRAAAKRGLICQTGGHGFTGSFFGLSELEWFDGKEVFERKIKDEDRQYLPLIDGKREVRHALGARFTELCYGNPEVRRRLVQCVADYAQSRPEVAMVHFWLSDAMNAQCECELCRDVRPSDFYVMMLNGIDQELASRGIATRIVFHVYEDILWPPERERIANPDRFVMVFCPIKREYSEPYVSQGDDRLLAPYELNKNAQPSRIEGFIASLRGWQKCFGGEAFAYDYHMTWYHYLDLGYYGFTRVLAEDIRRLPQLGLGGFVSCQVLRCSFPTGFPMYVHARVLWNPQEDVEALAGRYFRDAFGADGELCRDYMKRLSELSAPDCFYWSDPEKMSEAAATEAAGKLSRVDAAVAEFRPVIERNLGCADRARALSWQYLFIHAALVTTLARALRAKAQGNRELADAYWAEVVEHIVVNEQRLELAFDPFYFFSAMERRGFRYLGTAVPNAV